MKSVVLLSGGIDSYLAALLARERRPYLRGLCVARRGTSGAFDVDGGVVLELADSIGIPLEFVHISADSPFGVLPGALEEVPGRNVLYALLAAMSLAPDGGEVVLGITAEDSDYLDCRADGYRVFERAVESLVGCRVVVETPVAWYSKVDVLRELYGRNRLAYALGATVSCYRGARTPHEWGLGCGVCRACEERRLAYEAFAAALPGWRKDAAAG